MLSSILIGLVILLSLVFLVVVHEFGHFLLAKFFGIKVLEFGIGLPPRAWGKKIGETLYSLNWLPLGGFVRLLGEDATDEKVLNDPRSFASQPVWQRMIVVVAGVVVNLLVAVILFWLILAFQGFKTEIPLLIPYHFVGVTQTDKLEVLIGQVAPHSPASLAGLKSGDRITQINNHKLSSPTDLVDLTKELAGKQVTLDLEDTNNNFRQVEVTPRQNPPAGQGPLGVEIGAVETTSLNYSTPVEKIFAGFIHSYNITAYSLSIFGQLISSSVSTKSLGPVSTSISGPVGVVEIGSSILTASSPLLPYLSFIALISLNLGIINILPIPPLDGNRLFFQIIELLFGKRIKPALEQTIQTIGFVLIILLTILITYSDIKKFF